MALPAFFTPAALAERWGVSVNQVYAFVDAGELGFVHLGMKPPKKRTKGRKMMGFTEAHILEFEMRRSKLWVDESKAPRLPPIEEDKYNLMGLNPPRVKKPKR